MKYLIFAVFFSISLTVKSQILQGGGSGNTMGQGGLPGSTQQNNRNAFQDTTKKARKPGDKFLDDSTKQIYGAYSTRYKYFSDYYQITNKRHIVDTTIENFHRYNFVNRGSNQWQDLGTVGTAIKPLFPLSPTEVGSRLGIDVFSRYIFDFESVRFFNTRSPYSEWTYAQGGSGRSVLDVCFAINSGPDFNFSVGYRSLGSKLLTGNLVQSNRDRQARHRSFYVSSVWERKGYKILFFALNYNHVLLETGGLSLSDDVQSLRELYQSPPQRLDNKLTDVRAEQKGFRFNVYQQFAIDSIRFHFFSYHSLTTQTQLYLDPNLQSNGNFYPFTYFSEAPKTSQKTNFQVFENWFGAKTRVGAFFLSAYLRQRSFRYSQIAQTNFENGLNIGPETSLNSTMSLTFRKLGRIAFDAEYLFFKNYRLRSTIDFKWFSGGYMSMLYRPALVQRHFVGNHAWWFNPFKSIFHNEIYGQATLKIGTFSFQPKFRLLNLNDWIYHNENAEPVQAVNPENLLQVSTSFKLKTGAIHHLTDLIFTRVNENSVLRLPQGFFNYQFYYLTNIKKGKMLLALGLDNHYRTAFRADAYNPFIEQFYLQNRFTIGDYWQCDFFANALVNRSRFFVKVTNILQNIVGVGDFSTPGYMMQPRQFEFGLSWMSFD